MKRIAVLALMVVLAACGMSGPDYSGQYVGNVVDAVGGAGDATITLSQSGNQLTGAWQISFGSGRNSGFLQGVVNGGSISAQLYPSRSDACPYDLVATRSSNTLSGNYAAFNCTVSVSGTFVGVKQ